jgi:hypothetical protein
VRDVAQPSVKFLDQTRLADPRLAYHQHQLAITLPRPLPAPHQHGDFFLTTDKRSEWLLRHLQVLLTDRRYTDDAQLITGERLN